MIASTLPIPVTPGCFSVQGAPAITASSSTTVTTTSTPIMSLVGGATTPHSRPQLQIGPDSESSTKRSGTFPQINSTPNVTLDHTQTEDVDPLTLDQTPRDDIVNESNVEESYYDDPGEIDTDDVMELPGSTPGGIRRDESSSNRPTLLDSSEDFQESPLPKTPSRSPKKKTRPQSGKKKTPSSVSLKSRVLNSSSKESTRGRPPSATKKVIVTRSMNRTGGEKHSSVKSSTPSRRGTKSTGSHATPKSTTNFNRPQHECTDHLKATNSSTLTRPTNKRIPSSLRKQSCSPRPRQEPTEGEASLLTSAKTRRTQGGKHKTTSAPRPPLPPTSRPATKPVGEKCTTSSLIEKGSGSVSNVVRSPQRGVSSKRERGSKRRLTDDDSEGEQASGLRKKARRSESRSPLKGGNLSEIALHTRGWYYKI